MNRRATLATLMGKKSAKVGAKKSTALTLTTGLDTYLGTWDYELAAHLLRRSMYGPTYAQIKDAVNQGMEATIDMLFAESPLPDPPINLVFEEDPNVPIGETWIDAPYSEDINLFGYRYRSLFSWTIQNIVDEGISIREKMTTFWDNHFGMGNINDPKFRYRYSQLYREFATGNFKELIKRITIEPAMLRFLNGNQNTKNAPNENYAREVLELFTIGKGPQIAPGDYTNYTEDDVIAIAKVLTGWRDRGFRAFNPDVQIESIFRPNRHHTGDKQLSEHFGNAVISNEGENEYRTLIDIIFQQAEVARFICRKFYRWFVYYVIDDNAEVNVIEPMATMLIENDFEIEPVLRALLSSEHFYDAINLGPMIKNPMDFVMSAIKTPGNPFPDDPVKRYNIQRRIFPLIDNMEMSYYNLPSVAGWKAYYQEPGFYRIWINSTTLQVRMGFTDRMTVNPYTFGGTKVGIDPLAFVASLDDPSDPNSVIEEFTKILFPQPITDGQKEVLKEILIPGLPDYEWTVEYNDYLANPDDENLANAVASKLKNLLQAMLSMPEFYLS